MRKFISGLFCAVLIAGNTSVVYAEDTDSQPTDENNVEISETEVPVETEGTESHEEVSEEINSFEDVQPQYNSLDSMPAQPTTEPESDSLSSSNAYIIEDELSVQAHVQNIGWMSSVNNDAVAGTTGQRRRLEAVRITLSPSLVSAGLNISVQAHVKDGGWQNAAGNGQIAGTTGQSRAIDALKISLTGALADQYDIYYRTHISDFGWLGWASNGMEAGSMGYGKQMEALQVDLERKGTASIQTGNASRISLSAIYKAHVQNIGWMPAVNEAGIAGTTGRALNLEALQVSLPESLRSGLDIHAQAQIQNIGWRTYADGDTVTLGTTGRRLALEGFRLSLSGPDADKYDIYYRGHAAGIGWLGWTADGQLAGSDGCNRPLEAVQIDIVPKGTNKYVLGQGYTTKKRMHSSGWLLDNGVWHHYNSAGDEDVTQTSAPSIINEPGYYISPMKTGNLNSSSERIEAMIARAYEYMGTRWIVCRSTEPGGAADCSGLVMQCLMAAGFDPSPATPAHHARRENEYDSRTLYYQTPMRHVPVNSIRRGDIIWWATGNTIIHVGIYLGNGQVIDSWPPKVAVHSINWSGYGRAHVMGAARPFE